MVIVFIYLYIYLLIYFCIWHHFYSLHLDKEMKTTWTLFLLFKAFFLSTSVHWKPEMPCLFCLPFVRGRNQSKLRVMYKLSPLNMHVIGRRLRVRTNQTAGMKGQSPRPRLVRRGSDGRQSLRRQRFPLERNTMGKGNMREKENMRKWNPETEKLDEWIVRHFGSYWRGMKHFRMCCWKINSVSASHHHIPKCIIPYFTNCHSRWGWREIIYFTWKHCCPSKQVLTFLWARTDRQRKE